MPEAVTSDWITTPFGALCQRIVNGGTPETGIPSFWGGDTPWITGADFTTRGIGEFRRHVSELGIRASATSVVKQGNLLVVTRTGVGKLAIAPCDVAISQDITGIYIDPQKADTEFVYYLLSRELDELKKLNQGTSINGIVRTDLEQHSVSIPCSTAVQKKLVAVLRSIDAAIDRTDALIAKHQQIKAGLMHDLFTRGVLPNGQLRTTRNEAPELYQETELGWIPKDWHVLQAGVLCSLITKGTTPAANDMWEEGDGIRFLRVDNLTLDGGLDFSASSYKVSVATHMKALNRSRCFPGDVLTNIVGPPLGKVGLVTNETGELNINQAIAVFRPKEALSPRFLLSWLTTETALRWFLQRAKQTSGQLNLTLGICQAMPVPLMALAEQQLILDRSEGIEKLIAAEQSRLQKLGAQKVGLMQDLLTGRVSVEHLAPELASA